MYATAVAAPPPIDRVIRKCMAGILVPHELLHVRCIREDADVGVIVTDIPVTVCHEPALLILHVSVLTVWMHW